MFLCTWATMLQVQEGELFRPQRHRRRLLLLRWWRCGSGRLWAGLLIPRVWGGQPLGNRLAPAMVGAAGPLFAFTFLGHPVSGSDRSTWSSTMTTADGYLAAAATTWERKHGSVAQRRATGRKQWSSPPPRSRPPSPENMYFYVFACIYIFCLRLHSGFAIPPLAGKQTNIKHFLS
jgi:hypothetical protein